jgi:acetate kinase
MSTSRHPGASRILALNAGSSSIKFAVFDATEPPLRRWSGELQGIGQSRPMFRAHAQDEADPAAQVVHAPDHAAASGVVLEWIARHAAGPPLAAIGHRVVHGGPDFSAPQLVTVDLVTALHRFSAFDPEHLPAELGLIEASRQRFPGVPQVACFDTAFHHDLPEVASRLPLPRRYAEQGVRRYGFHGLSYAFLMRALAAVDNGSVASGRVILAHLGSGASLAAVRDGRPMDTTMSFTPTSGVPMSTRSGDLDPSLYRYLAQTESMSPARFNALVNDESGLLGVSGTSGDMHDLLAREADDAHAAEAVAMFCYEVRKRIGAFAAVLGGLDVLVFAGGIGEHAPTIRQRICEGLGFLGIELDAQRNAGDPSRISLPSGRVAVYVMATDEEIMIARAAARILEIEPPSSAASATDTDTERS